jgi:glycerophosphoryl diester phosphodiesterase
MGMRLRALLIFNLIFLMEYQPTQSISTETSPDTLRSFKGFKRGFTEY